MSLVTVNFVSKKLCRNVTFNAIIPLDRFPDASDDRQAKPLKTLYLLHGMFGNYTDFLSGTRIQRWAEASNLAVIMPSGDNHFYIDKPDQDENYSSYVGDELVAFTRKMFPLSHKKEDTFIGGLSMGGYGALINGLNYQDTFGYIGAFSPGLIVNHLDPKSEMSIDIGMSPGFIDNVFGGIDTVKNSDKDYYYLIKELVKAGKKLPHIYLPIGKADFLLDYVREFKAFMDENGLDFTYIEDEGGHEWDFWDKYTEKFLEWLPLDKVSSS